MSPQSVSAKQIGLVSRLPTALVEEKKIKLHSLQWYRHSDGSEIRNPHVLLNILSNLGIKS